MEYIKYKHWNKINERPKEKRKGKKKKIRIIKI
jgi:hypothetical protein